ncbi:low molecular weight protein-tyrosine-phosphatase [Aureibacter tunicatorum]|uniref:Protein-tyrosine phosphatase n=1 Tax=Aureibacter tunicatorum TaxID=866807 RepID=A0AAE3XQ21_9BACT|nr:low molecular weight protein-tyrosine-phosphatase [Aureibacter tunicatorum]MDR6241037.1 protein-tyrosine phosphatase [Aureibacter tunicatorum]BDD03815.1 phosphotyrosine protein phosphatase [Aureibacter tunicatorum]
MKKVLFVCLGNICRSPLAEGIFDHLIQKRGYTQLIGCDSAGTAAYHIGKSPDPRSIEVAEGHGIVLRHKARQFEIHDFEDFDYIFAMDYENLKNIRKIENPLMQTVYDLKLMRAYDPEGIGEVPDPYYGGQEGFENVYRMLYRSLEKFLDKLEETFDLKSIKAQKAL